MTLEPKLTKELRALREDPRLAKLRCHVPPLSLVRILGVERNEVTHTTALAYLLDPISHRNAKTVMDTLLREISDRPGLDADIANALHSVAEGPWKRVVVHREHLFIDVVVEFASANGRFVLGIENKIDAGEQSEQLSRYQAALERAYPGRMIVLAFLTPTGRAPTTARQADTVPVVSLGYEAVLSAVRNAREQAASRSRDERALLEFEDHLREEILGEPREVEAKNMARELWRTHGRALRLVMENRPRFSDIRQECVRLLSERYPDAHFQYYPERRADLREVKMYPASWHERGLPFTFMLETNGPDGRLRARTLVWQESYKQHGGSLASWARQVNASGELLVDDHFTRVRNWNWHKVFAEEDFPEEAVIEKELEENAFDARTARAAFDAVVEHVELLRPYVESD